MRATSKIHGDVYIHIHQIFLKICLVLACILCVYVLFAMPIEASETSEKARSEKVKLNITDLLEDKQLAYANMSSFDVRNKINNVVFRDIFNQEFSGTCWANASLMQLTLSMRRQAAGDYIFSRRHAALTLKESLEFGGTFQEIAGYITAGQGPILERNMPWKPIPDKKKEPERYEQNLVASEDEEILLETLTPEIKVNSWERLPSLRKYINEKGNIVYYEINESEQPVSILLSDYYSQYNKLNREYKFNWLMKEKLSEDSEKHKNATKDDMEKIIKKWEEELENKENDVTFIKTLISFYEEYYLQMGIINFDEYCKKEINSRLEANKKVKKQINEITEVAAKKIGRTLSAEEVENRRNMIKENIVKYGAVEVIMKADYGINGVGDTGTYKYKGYNYSFYQAGEWNSNHEVVLIGWDDNYSVDNFPEEFKPTKPGAYLVQNSWGANWLDNGCFWISYEDANIEICPSVFKDVVKIDYDNIYSRDFALASCIYKENAKSMYGANIFDRNNPEQREVIKEVAVANVCETSYEVYINPTGEEINDESKLVKVAVTGELPAGYNTIKFKEIELTGEKFAVVVKYTNENGHIGVGTQNDCAAESKYYFVNSGSSSSEEGVIDYNQAYIGEKLDKMIDIFDGEDKIRKKYKVYGNIAMASPCIKAFTNVTDKDDVAYEEEPNPSEISKISNTTRVEGQILTGKITREDLNQSSNYSTFSTQKGGEMPERGNAEGLGIAMGEMMLGGNNTTTTVSTGGKSQVVDNPEEGQTLFMEHKEDGASVQTIYPNTTSVSLANYEVGDTVQVGKSGGYQESYIFTHMRENNSYNSEIQQALWSTDLNTGEKLLPNALGKEANEYAIFRNNVNTSGGYERNIENQTVGQTVTYNRKTKQYTIGPFKVKYIRGFANVEGREKVDFGAMIDIKMYDQRDKEINKETWKVIWNEKDKKERQEGDNNYEYPYSEEEFYIQMNYEGNEEVTSISKFEYYYKELNTTGEFVKLNGNYRRISMESKCPRIYVYGRKPAKSMQTWK